jgi:hypothetical protein
VRPNVAYFGQKDFQQTLVVEDLARAMGYPRIRVCPTVRESSGRPLGWDSPETADLLAFLVFRLTGRPANVETHSPQEGSR